VKKLLSIPLVLLLLLPLLSAQSLRVAECQTELREYSMQSQITYVNPAVGSKIWNLTEDDRTIGLFMNNSWQNVELKSTTSTLEALKVDVDGNNIGVLELPKEQLLPGENVSIAVEYHIVTKPRVVANISITESGTLGVIPKQLAQLYAGAEGPWLLNDPVLVDLADEIGGNETNVLRIVTRIVGWIKENIVYGTHETPLYPNQTLSVGVGDCDDQAVLLIALLRILGIPSYLQIGAIYTPEYVEVSRNYWNNHVRIVQRKIGWHGWAVVYVPPWGWLPVDLTFVLEGFDDPLNAIRYGAAVRQNTIQYMNISTIDYVADSRQSENFLTKNGFFVYLEEEMIEFSQSGGVSGLNPATTVILVVMVVAAVLLIAFLILIRRRGRAKDLLT